MKKPLALALFSGLFLAVFTAPTRALEGTEALAPSVCAGDFFRHAKTGMACLVEDAFFSILIFPPEKASLKATFEPVLYLPGGPGILVTPQRDRFAKLATGLGRTILVPAVADSFDYLDCQSDDTADAIWGIGKNPEDAIIYGKKDHKAKLDACLEHLIDNASVRAKITTQQVATALKTVREIFGIARWHIFAESYGSRMALALAAEDRNAILSQILDSPETPWTESYWHTGANLITALGNLSALCRNDYYCPARRLRLGKALLAGIASYDVGAASPLALKNSITGQIDAYARPTRTQLLISSFHALRVPERAAFLPYIAAARSPQAMQERFGLLLNRLLFPYGGLNMGLHHLIRCSELPLEKWYTALERGQAAHPPLTPLLRFMAWRQRYICEALQIEPPEGFPVPDFPDVPTLVLSGGLDPATPATIVQAAFPKAPAYRHFIYETLGHVVHLQASCVQEDVARFMANSGIGMERSVCKKSDLKIRFYTPVVIR